MADPYVVANPGVAVTGTTQTLSVTRATSPGDHIVVATAVAGSGGVTGVADSRGNTYTLQESDTPGNGVPLFTYLADGATTALQVGDTITITYGLTYATKTAVVIGVPGTATTSLDQKNVADSTGSAAPSVTSPTLTQASEIVIGVIGSAQASGDPVWAAGWNKLS